jgi:hypothetical protein
MFSLGMSGARDGYERFLEKSDDGRPMLENDGDLTRRRDIPLSLTMADEHCQDEASGTRDLLENVAVRVCQDRNLSVSALRGASQLRELAQARKLFIRCAVAGGARPSDIATFLNRVPSAISNLLRNMNFVKA